MWQSPQPVSQPDYQQQQQLQGGYPQQQGGYPPQQGGYPPQQVAYAQPQPPAYQQQVAYAQPQPPAYQQQQQQAYVYPETPQANQQQQDKEQKERRTRCMAVAAIVFGSLGCPFFGCPCAVAGIAMGGAVLCCYEKRDGHGVAAGGLALGLVGFLLTLTLFVVFTVGIISWSIFAADVIDHIEDHQEATLDSWNSWNNWNSWNSWNF